MPPTERANPPRVLLGVTGGIAAYKAPELVRRLTERGCEVQVVMTAGAKQFVKLCPGGGCAMTSGIRPRRLRWDTSSSRAGPMS